MSYYRLLSLSFLLSTTLFAFQDADIDGVEDSIDLCPDTSFDVLVDKNGCPQSGEEKRSDDYFGRLTLKIGADISRDKIYEDSDTLNLYANYRYRKWDISLSNSRATTKSSYTEDNSNSDNDIYLSTGYLFSLPKSSLKLSLGTKIVNDDSTNNSSHRGESGYGQYANKQNSEENNVSSSRDNDYFASLNFNYMFSKKQDIFLYYGYTLSGDSDELDYENYSSFSMGTGYALTNNWYSGVSYNYTDSIYPNTDAEQSLSWFNSYKFGQNIFGTLSYRYALEDFSYDHTLSVGLGVYFE